MVGRISLSLSHSVQWGKNKWRRTTRSVEGTYHSPQGPTPSAPIAPEPFSPHPAPHLPLTQALETPYTCLNMISIIQPRGLCPCRLFSMPATFFPGICISHSLQLCSNIIFPVRPFLFTLKLSLPPLILFIFLFNFCPPSHLSTPKILYFTCLMSISHIRI